MQLSFLILRDLSYYRWADNVLKNVYYSSISQATSVEHVHINAVHLNPVAKLLDKNLQQAETLVKVLVQQLLRHYHVP